MVTKITSKVTDKFILGLKHYGLTYDDILNSGWKYCGGNEGHHRNYYKLCYPGEGFPQHSDTCICGRFIRENCYITNGKDILILGNCCIKRFIPKSSRTCEICEQPHKNRKVNRCANCRKGICHKCGHKIYKKFKICYNCIDI